MRTHLSFSRKPAKTTKITLSGQSPSEPSPKPKPPPKLTATKSVTGSKSSIELSIPKFRHKVFKKAVRIGFSYVNDTVINKDFETFADKFRDEIIELGPICIKIGQIMSCRKDIIPDNVTSILEKLQDNVPPFTKDADEIENYIRCELLHAKCKEDLYDIFEYIEQEPIAAASIAQVHRGKLKNGIEVAIKIQRPYLALELLGYMEVVNWLENIPLRIRFVQDLIILLKESVKNIKKELDFIQEAKNMLLMQQVFAEYEDILVPRVYSKLCTKRMLVMEYIPGKSIKSVQSVELSDQLMSAFVNSTLKFNCFHSDPHPGNISITPDNKLAIYDYGLVTRLDENISGNENKTALYAAYNMDVDAVIRYVIKSRIIHLKRGDVNDVDDLTNSEYIILYKIISYFLDYIKNININEIGEKIVNDSVLISTARDSPFYLDSIALLMLRTFSTLEGTCKMMNPDFSYTNVLKPLLPSLSSDMNFFVQQMEKNIIQLGDVQSNMRKTLSNQKMHDARIHKISDEVDSVRSTSITFAVLMTLLIGFLEFL